MSKRASPQAGASGGSSDAKRARGPAATAAATSIETLSRAILESRDGDEVELRLGRSVGEKGGQRFVAGVSQEDFGTFLRVLQTDGGLVHTTTDELMLVYDGPERSFSTTRAACDPQTRKVLRVDVKRKMAPAQGGGLLPGVDHLSYVMRLGVAQEEIIAATPEECARWRAPAERPNTERRRRRHTFARRGQWTTDLTEVTTERGQGKEVADATTWEVEVELHPDLLRRSKRSLEESKKAAMAVWGYMEWLAVQCKVRNDAHWFGDLAWNPLTTPEAINSVTAYLKQALPDGNSMNSFPGSMPVNLHRSHFRVIQTSEYIVSEKTDGVRFLLFCIGGRSGVYLIDRSFRLFPFPMAGVPEALTTEPGKLTLLDGELVRHQKTFKAMFLVFDVICHNSTPVWQWPLSKRLPVIGRSIIEPYRQAVKANQVNEAGLPFILLGKMFFKKSEIGALFGMISGSGHSRIFCDPNNKRCHRTDGVIYAPDVPYTTRGSASLYKWKYSTGWTVDFVISPCAPAKEHRQKMVCGGSGSNRLVELKDSSLSPEDREKLKAEAEILGLAPTADAVAECAFDTNAGVWTFCGLRTDKQTPNHVSVVMDTLEVLAEGVTQNELVYRTVCTPETDLWETLYQAAIESAGSTLVAQALKSK